MKLVVQTYSDLEVGLLDRDVDSTENEVHECVRRGGIYTDALRSSRV